MMPIMPSILNRLNTKLSSELCVSLFQRLMVFIFQAIVMLAVVFYTNYVNSIVVKKLFERVPFWNTQRCGLQCNHSTAIYLYKHQGITLAIPARMVACPLVQ